MWKLKACTGKCLLSKNELEGDFSIILMAIYIYMPFQSLKFLRIRHSKIEFQRDFSKFAFNSYAPFQLKEILRIRPLGLNLEVTFSNNNYCA